MKPKSFEITRLSNGYSNILSKFNTGGFHQESTQEKEKLAQERILRAIKDSPTRNNLDGETRLILLTPSQTNSSSFDSIVSSAFTSAEFTDVNHIRALDLSKIVADSAATPAKILATVLKNLVTAEQQLSESILDLPIDKLAANNNFSAKDIFGKASHFLRARLKGMLEDVREYFSAKGDYLAYIKLPKLEINNEQELNNLCQLILKVGRCDFSNITINTGLLNYKALIRSFFTLDLSSDQIYKLLSSFKEIKGNTLNIALAPEEFAELAKEAYDLSIQYHRPLACFELSANNFEARSYKDLQHLALLASATDCLQLTGVKADNSLLNIYNFISLLNEATTSFSHLHQLFIQLDENTNGAGSHKRKINFTEAGNQYGFKKLAASLRQITANQHDQIRERLGKIEGVIASNKDKDLEEVTELQTVLSQFELMEQMHTVRLRHEANCGLLQCELDSIIAMKQRQRLDGKHGDTAAPQISSTSHKDIIEKNQRNLLLQCYVDGIERSILKYQDQIEALYHLERALETFKNEQETCNFLLRVAIEGAFRHSKTRVATAILQFAIENSSQGQAFDLRAFAIKTIMCRNKAANSYSLIAAAVQGKEAGKLLSLAINEAIKADKLRLAIKLLDLAIEKGITIGLPEILEATFDIRAKIPAEYQCYQFARKKPSLEGFIDYFLAHSASRTAKPSPVRQRFSDWINYEFADVGFSLTPLFLAKISIATMAAGAAIVTALLLAKLSLVALGVVAVGAALAGLGYAGYQMHKYRNAANDVFRGKDITAGKASYDVAYNNRKIEVKAVPQATAMPKVTKIVTDPSTAQYLNFTPFEELALQIRTMVTTSASKNSKLIRLYINFDNLMKAKGNDSVKLQVGEQFIYEFRKSIEGANSLIKHFEKHFPLWNQSQTRLEASAKTLDNDNLAGQTVALSSTTGSKRNM